MALVNWLNSLSPEARAMYDQKVRKANIGPTERLNPSMLPADTETPAPTHDIPDRLLKALIEYSVGLEVETCLFHDLNIPEGTHYILIHGVELGRIGRWVNGDIELYDDTSEENNEVNQVDLSDAILKGVVPLCVFSEDNEVYANLDLNESNTFFRETLGRHLKDLSQRQGLSTMNEVIDFYDPRIPNSD